MKATLDREGLLASIQIVNSVVPSRTPKAILQNVKLVVAAEKSYLSATDLEAVSIRLEVRGVKVEKPGEALLPVARVMSILREAPDQELLVEADTQSCVIMGQHSRFELPGEDPAQFPDVAGFDAEEYHQVQASVLRELIGRTIFATAQENARYALTGVLWELDKEKVRLVATDGRRLAISEGIGVPHGSSQKDGQMPVVPTKAMSLLERNLSDAEEQVLVSIDANEARFQTGRAVLTSRLVEGRYPPYKEVFPKKTAAKVKLTMGPFQAAVRQAAILTDEDSRGVDFHFDKGKLTLQARVADKGQAKIDLPIEYDGKAIDICFNPKFVIEMLRTLDPSTEILLEMLDGNSAALFKIGDDYSYIVMPLTRDSR